jgi:hypothetical protein
MPALELAAVGARGELHSQDLWRGSIPPDVAVLVANDLVVP